MDRFQLYKKVHSGWMHISSGKFKNRIDAINCFNITKSPLSDFFKSYYVGGLLKPRFETKTGNSKTEYSRKIKTFSIPVN